MPGNVAFRYVGTLRMRCFPALGHLISPLTTHIVPPEASPRKTAVRAKRALRSAPVVLVRGVGMPAYTETGASIGV